MPTGLSPSVGALLNQSNSLLGLPGLPAGLFKPPVMPGPPAGGLSPVGGATVNSISAYLHSKGSPLANYAATFVQAGRKYGVDPNLLVAIAGAESSFGTTGNSASLHNAWGNGPGIRYPSWDAGINAVAAHLKNDYLNQGLTTIPAIQRKWAPVGAGNDPRNLNSNWTRVVGQFYQELGHYTTGSAAAAGHNPAVVVDHNQAVSPLSAPIIKLAAQYLGTPYVWGGANPQTGFDCSGFVQWLYGQKGVRLPRTTYEQWRVGRPVGKGQLQPGDIIFFNEGDPRGPSHEGLYIGHGQFIQAPHTGDVIKISSVNDSWYMQHFMGARRVA